MKPVLSTVEGIEAPRIDTRTPEELLREIRSRVPLYTPEWTPSDQDAGLALMRIFTPMLEAIIQRLNRAPEKYFTTFLDTLGIKLLPAQPARSPVTFFLAEGTQEHVFIPSGTQVAAGETLFETEKSILATPARLVKAYSIDAKLDRIYVSPANVVSGEPVAPFKTELLYAAGEGNKEIFVQKSEGLRKGDLLNIGNQEYGIVADVSDAKITLCHKLERHHKEKIAVEKVTNFELFTGKNLQEHILYLGHKDVFNVKTQMKFTLTIPRPSEFANTQLVSWQYWGEPERTKVLDWYDFTVIPEEAANNEPKGEIILEKKNNDEMKEREINGIPSRWIRCIVNSSQISSIKDVTIGTIDVTTMATQGNIGISPDMAFYNDIPLDLGTLSDPNVIYPFGTRPRQLDTFYIGSQEAFSKKNAQITMTFDITRKEDNTTPVIQVQGVGKKFEHRLQAAGIHTVGELLRHTKDELKDILKKSEEDPPNYYSTRAINILEAARKGLYDKSGTLKTRGDTQDDAEDLTLSWEYWNGKGWQVIRDLEGFRGNPPNNNNDYEFKFLETGGVKFTCPEDMEIVNVAGQENYWVRVRIVSGDYGKELVYQGDNWIPGTINPPVITKMTMSYSYGQNPNIEHCLIYNNLEYQDVSEEIQKQSTSFLPFQSLAEESDENHKTLYLGFDTQIEKGPISLFFSFEEGDILETTKQKIDWEYYAQDQKWKGLEISDNTQGFTRTGTVEFFLPADFAKTSKFGEVLYWIRAIDIEDKIQTSPAVKGIYLNTTFAIQSERIEDEILGASDASPNQTFHFSRTPVFAEEIWVNEQGSLSEQEKKRLRAEYSEEAVNEIKTDTGKTTELWIQWQTVEDFLDSTRNSRHYLIERATGEVTFGDGMFGMIPPVLSGFEGPMGKSNIKATYQFGGGTQGNVGASEISTLKTSIPYMDRVMNPEAAAGGAGTETLEAVFERGPYLIKHRNRAVTAEDFERVAKAASSFIARAKCVVTGGSVKVIIIPYGEEEQPTPSLELMKTVEKYLLDRGLNTLLPGSLKVQKPDYITVSIRVDVVPESIDLAVPLEKEIVKQLKAFLHPLTGGPEQRGWEFGRDVHISDVYALLEGIKGVDHAENLLLNGGQKVEIKEFETVCSGGHRITMKM